MILFKDIYKKAVNLFDDPEIKRAYFFDVIRWQKMMYCHLQEGLARFENPTKVTYLLVDQIDPIGKLETFEGAGQDTFTLTTSPVDGSDFSFMINGKVDEKAVYDEQTKTVTFSRVLAQGDIASVEWYFGGAFTTDFVKAETSEISATVIQEKVQQILARCLLVAWAENEENFVLDIKNILTDTDFKIHSPANSIVSKGKWVDGLRRDLDTKTNKLCWNFRSRRYHGGNYYG